MRAASGSRLPSSRTKAPTAWPSSAGRPRASPFQNGRRPGCPGRRGDQHPVVGDVLDPPRRRAQGEDVADPGLVDHLLVELTDPGLLLADQEDAEQPAVGDRPAAGDGQPLRPGSGGQLAGDAVPDDAGPELGEGVVGVAAREHVEHRVVGALRQGRERRGAADQGEQVVDLPGVDGEHRHDLLREHVEGVARHVQRLDLGRAHALGDDGGLDEVAAVLREDHALAHRADLVAGATDPLQAARDRRRATRPGRRGRPPPCRCRARGCWWRRPPRAVRTSAPPR